MGFLTENSDRRRVIHLVQAALPGNFQHVEQTGHVDVPGPHRVFFAGGAQDGGQVVNLVDTPFFNDGFQSLPVESIQDFRGPRLVF